jgi:hypothetical protein
MRVGHEFQLAVDDAVENDDDNDNSSPTIAFLLSFSLFVVTAADDTVIDDGDDSGTLNVARESIWSSRFHFFFDFLDKDKEDVIDEDEEAAEEKDFFFRCRDVMSRAGRLWHELRSSKQSLFEYIIGSSSSLSSSRV